MFFGHINVMIILRRKKRLKTSFDSWNSLMQITTFYQFLSGNIWDLIFSIIICTVNELKVEITFVSFV